METQDRRVKVLACIVVAVMLLGIGTVSRADVTGTAFKYQGRLTDTGSPATARYDLKFSLYDALTVGNQVGSTHTELGVPVNNGYFQVDLEFGSVFRGDARWLEIQVAPEGEHVFTTLSPRQELTPAPYAVHAGSADTLDGGIGIDGAGTVNYLAKFSDVRIIGNSQIFDNGSHVGIGTSGPGERLSVNGMVESITGGFKFPDGSVQTTADSGPGSSLWQQSGNKIYYNSGPVGIGTSNPMANFVVEKQSASNIEPMAILRTTGASSAAALRFQNALGNRFNFGITGNDELALGYNSNISLATDLLRITSAGNVGIGTTNPNYKLEVFDTSGSWIKVVGSVNPSGIKMQHGAFAEAAVCADGDDLHFRTNDIDRMVIDLDGYVGIGTTSPGSRLHVEGTIEVDDTIKANDSSGLKFATDDGDTVLKITDEGYISAGVPGGFVSNEKLSVMNEFDSTDKIENVAAIRRGSTGTIANGIGVGLIFGNEVPDGAYSNSGRIASIMEEVSSPTTAGMVLQTRNLSGNLIDGLYLDSEQRVGIGTRYPDEKLVIRGSSANIEIRNTDETDAGILFTDASYSTTERFSIYFDSSSTNLNFYDSDDLQARIRPDASAQNDDGWTTATIDYGEFMEKLDHNEQILPFEVVGIKNGKVTKNTDGATLYMVSSSDAGIRGGDPVDSPRDNDEAFVVVAFAGQVPVVVDGLVEEGDYLLPSGMNDGKAIAVSSETIDFETYRKAIGVVLNIVDEKYYTHYDLKNSDGGWEQDLKKLLEGKGDNTLVNTAIGIK